MIVWKLKNYNLELTQSFKDTSQTHTLSHYSSKLIIFTKLLYVLVFNILLWHVSKSLSKRSLFFNLSLPLNFQVLGSRCAKSKLLTTIHSLRFFLECKWSTIYAYRRLELHLCWAKDESRSCTVFEKNTSTIVLSKYRFKSDTTSKQNLDKVLSHQTHHLQERLGFRVGWNDII